MWAWKYFIKEDLHPKPKLYTLPQNLISTTLKSVLTLWKVLKSILNKLSEKLTTGIKILHKRFFSFDQNNILHG